MPPGMKRRRRRLLMRRKRVLDSSIIIDYKKPDILKKFITERGKIIPSRVSGATSAQQIAIAREVKRARYLALIPSSVAHEKEKGFVGEMSEIAQTFAASAMRQRSRGDYRGDSRHQDRDGENRDTHGGGRPAHDEGTSAAGLSSPGTGAEN